ncbi:charged multivesicular body protein 4c-like isoform X2 [Myzus persicae]|uniref:charged multivesicular body protein 4c-like isoform X2 n=1 Tax=Myzus persicae TaxID=13164 RepID=UPI000B931733|nr:charged multivesicular body protein 4c-like isoform X2 [Myzus persicae]
MNFFRKLFGGKKKETQKLSTEPSTEPSDEVDALVNMRSTERFLMERREILNTNIKKELATIKQNVISNKRVALNALKRKNCYEKQASQIEGILSTVIQQRLALESVNTNTVLLNVMESTLNTVKMVDKNINIDDIHKMIDDIAKSHGSTQEISEASRNSATLEVDEDEEESRKGLENLELEELDEQVMNMDRILAVNYPLPVMPTFEPPAQIKKTSERRNSMMT